jgi:hypothetical protein
MKTKIRVTKTVTLGTKTLEEYKAAFEKQEKNRGTNWICFLDARYLVDQVQVAESEVSIDLVFVTLDELGVSLNMGWGQQKEMYEKAVLLGLQRVPPEAALALAP